VVGELRLVERLEVEIERAVLAERVIAEADGRPGRKLGRKMLQDSQRCLVA
jgi:hypothetical protein